MMDLTVLVRCRIRAAALDARPGVRQHLVGIGLVPVAGLVTLIGFVGRCGWARCRTLLLASVIGFRAEALFDDLDRHTERQAVGLQHGRGAAVSVADDRGEHDAAVDIVAAAAGGCRRCVQNAP